MRPPHQAGAGQVSGVPGMFSKAESPAQSGLQTPPKVVERGEERLKLCLLPGRIPHKVSWDRQRFPL